MNETLVDFPTRHEIAAARWTIHLLKGPTVAVADAQAAYRGSVSGAMFSQDELEQAQKLLERAGLLTVAGDVITVPVEAGLLAEVDEETAMRAVMARLLERNPPVWLRVAAGGARLQPELLPDDVVAQLTERLGANVPRRDAMLRAAVQRAEHLRVAGLEDRGVACVAEACRIQLQASGDAEGAEQVRVVGAVSRALACDVLAPDSSGGRRRLLVKTTRRLDWRLPIVLHREELEVGLAEPGWSLVVCSLGHDGVGEVLGWCSADALAGLIPSDNHPHGRWMVMSLLVLQPLLHPGLPPV